MWKDATDGFFSPKVAYQSIIKLRGNNSDEIWNRIWKLKITERLKLFLWKLGRDVLLLGNQLQRIFGNLVNYVLCGENVDSWLNLFCHCSLAKATWFGSQWAIPGENLNFSCPRDFVLWLRDPRFLGGASKEDREEFSKFCISLCDELWNVRNRTFHDQVFLTCMGALARVNSSCSIMVGAWEASALPHSQVSWENGMDQINGRRAMFVDAACKDLRSTAGIVVTDADGSTTGALSIQMEANILLEAETLALYHVLLWCISKGWSQVVYATHCQSLVKGIQGRSASTWRLAKSF
ncbi:hypothetical protein G4B88_002239 [Cannabis sativa]|uniref:RNase H type-1 domain-containing protein n=1 Tax=Cannabis sativa TaxID=3483 RepID=A0A7J6FSS8_CANSA|nr:hypothetical protein G4B88_002239 [Cannabis sativa]